MKRDIVRDRKFYRMIAALAVPIMLQDLLRISVDTFNSILLGSYDQLQMAALSQANQVFFIYYTVVNGFAVGAGVLAAQYWGRKDMDSIRRVLAAGLKAAFLIGLIAMAVVLVFPQAVLGIYSSDPELIMAGSGYLRICALMYPLCGLSLMFFGIMRSVEQVRVILLTNVISYSVNILLSWALLQGHLGLPALGINGMGLATVIARIVELCVIGNFVLRKEKKVQFRVGDLKRTDPVISGDFLHASAPIVSHEVIWSLGTSTSSMITGHLGSSVVAAYSVTVVLYNLCASVGNGYNNACSVVIGKTIGENDRRMVEKESKSMLWVGLLIGLLLSAVTWFGAEPFLSLYALDAETRAYALQFMKVFVVIWPFSLLEMTGTIAILRAGGDGKTGFYTDIVAMWMTTIPLAACGAFLWHWAPVVVVSVIKFAIVIEAMVGVFRVLSMKWIQDLTRH